MKYHFFRGKRMKFLQRIQQGILAVGLSVLLGESFAEIQAATLQIDSNINIYHVRQRGKQGGVWERGRDSLTAADLMGHLSDLKDPLTNAPRVENCFKELGRLILAQGLYVDNRISYDHDNLSNSGPNYINRQRAGSLYKTPTLSDLVDHLFDHGHLGWYPHAKLIRPKTPNSVVQLNPKTDKRGIFNINSIIRARITENLSLIINLANDEIILFGSDPKKGYLIDKGGHFPNLKNAAINLITKLFSSSAFENVEFGGAEQAPSRYFGDFRFNIYATYNEVADEGQPIPGIDYTHPTGSPLPPTNCLGLQSNGTSTNRIRLVVGVYNGTIYIASLFPEG